MNSDHWGHLLSPQITKDLLVMNFRSFCLPVSCLQYRNIVWPDVGCFLKSEYMESLLPLPPLSLMRSQMFLWGFFHMWCIWWIIFLIQILRFSVTLLWCDWIQPGVYCISWMRRLIIFNKCEILSEENIHFGFVLIFNFCQNLSSFPTCYHLFLGGRAAGRDVWWNPLEIRVLLLWSPALRSKPAGLCSSLPLTTLEHFSLGPGCVIKVPWDVSIRSVPPGLPLSQKMI